MISATSTIAALKDSKFQLEFNVRSACSALIAEPMVGKPVAFPVSRHSAVKGPDHDHEMRIETY